MTDNLSPKMIEFLEQHDLVDNYQQFITDAESAIKLYDIEILDQNDCPMRFFVIAANGNEAVEKIGQKISTLGRVIKHNTCKIVPFGIYQYRGLT